MDSPASPDLKELLDAARGGDEQALNRLFHGFYEDLRRVASARLRDGCSATLLDTTSLVHESYTRFAGLSRLDVKDRSQFPDLCLEGDAVGDRGCGRARGRAPRRWRDP